MSDTAGTRPAERERLGDRERLRDRGDRPETGARRGASRGGMQSVGHEPREQRALIRRIDTWTVFKVSLCFYLIALIVVLVAGVVVWQVATALGFIADIQKAVRSLADAYKFKLRAGVVLEWTAAVGAVLCVAGTLVNVIAAVIYNLISDVVGGVQLVEIQATARD